MRSPSWSSRRLPRSSGVPFTKVPPVLPPSSMSQASARRVSRACGRDTRVTAAYSSPRTISRSGSDRPGASGSTRPMAMVSCSIGKTFPSSAPPRRMTTGRCPKNSPENVSRTPASFFASTASVSVSFRFANSPRLLVIASRPPGTSEYFQTGWIPFEVGRERPASFRTTPILRSLSRCFFVFS